MARAWLLLLVAAAVVLGTASEGQAEPSQPGPGGPSADDGTIAKLMQQVRELNERNEALTQSLKRARATCGPRKGWEAGVGDAVVSLDEPTRGNTTAKGNKAGGEKALLAREALASELRGPDHEIAMDIREYFLAALARRNFTKELETAQMEMNSGVPYCQWGVFKCDNWGHVKVYLHRRTPWLRAVEPPADVARLPRLKAMQAICPSGRAVYNCGHGHPERDGLSLRLHEMKRLKKVFFVGWPDALGRFPSGIVDISLRISQNQLAMAGVRFSSTINWGDLGNLTSVRYLAKGEAGVCTDFLKGVEKARGLRRLQLRHWAPPGNVQPCVLPPTLPPGLEELLLMTPRVVGPPNHSGPSLGDALKLKGVEIAASGIMRGMFRGVDKLRSLADLRIKFQGDTSPPGYNGVMPHELGKIPALETFYWLEAPGAFHTFVIPPLNRMRRVSLDGLAMAEVPTRLLHGAPALEILTMNKNNITVIPDAVANMPKLKLLQLSSNMIDQAPDERLWRHFKENSIDLDLDGNPYYERPVPMEHMTVEGVVRMVLLELKTMNLSVRTPDPDEDVCRNGIFACTGREITQVSLEGLGLTQLPDAMRYLGASIEILDLAGNNLDAIPDDFFVRMTKLRRIFLSRNRFTSIPKAVLDLANLGALKMAWNRVTEFPDDINRHPICLSIADITMSHNKIESLPNTILSCKKLKILNFDSNVLKRVPVNWAMLRNLEVLQFSRNQIGDEAASGEIFLPKMRHFDFSGNKLTRFPTIRFSGAVETLFFHANELATIESEAYEALSSATEIQILDLSFNKITSIPENMFRAPVTRLILSHNMITELPANAFVTMGLGLRHLHAVSLAHNNLKEIPPPTVAGTYQGIVDIAKKEYQPYAESISFHFEFNPELRTFHPNFLAPFEAKGFSANLMLMGAPLLDLGTVVVPPGSSVMVDHTQMAYFTPTGAEPAGKELVRSFQTLESGDEILNVPGMRSRIQALTQSESPGALEFLETRHIYKTFHPPDDQEPLFKECVGYQYRGSGVVVSINRCLCISKFYAPASMPDQCRQCPALATCEKALVECAAGTFRQEVPLTAEDAFEPDVRCQACPEGGECADGLSAIPVQGYWANSTVTGQITACPNKNACTGGEDSECAVGYRGVLCGECQRGFYAGGAHECRACPNPAVSLAMFGVSIVAVVGVSIFVFLMAASIMGGSKTKSSKRSDRYATYASLLSTSRLGTLTKSIGVFKQTVSFLQIITTLDVTFDIPWPGMMSLLDDVFGWVNLDVVKSTSFECVWETISDYANASTVVDVSEDSTIESTGFGYSQRVVVTALLPVSVSLILFAVNAGYRCLYRTPIGRSLQRRANTIDRNVMQRLCVQCHLLVWQFSYLPVSYLAIQYFHCRSFDGGETFYIANDLSTRCYSATYWLYAWAAVVILVLYTLGMPLWVLCVGLRQMWRTKRGVTTAPGTATESLYKAYKKEYPYWEALEMLRKVVIGGFVVLLSGSPTFQLSVALGVLFLFTVAYCRCWPNENAASNAVQAFILVLTYCTMCLGMLRSLTVPEQQGIAFTVTILAADILVVAGVFCMVGYDAANAASDRVNAMTAALKRSHKIVEKVKARAAAGGGLTPRAV